MKTTTLGEQVRASALCHAEPFNENRVDGHHISGWMQHIELYWICEVAKWMNSVIEVGSWHGRSAYAFAKNCPGHVTCVDHFHGGTLDWVTAHADENDRKIFEENLKEFLDSGKVTLVDMESSEAAKVVEQADLVFIDSDHSYEATKKAIEDWGPKAKLILCGHDYFMEGVNKAVNEYFGGAVQKGFGSIWYVELCNGIARVA